MLAERSKVSKTSEDKNVQIKIDASINAMELWV